MFFPPTPDLSFINAFSAPAEAIIYLFPSISWLKNGINIFSNLNNFDISELNQIDPKSIFLYNVGIWFVNTLAKIFLSGTYCWPLSYYHYQVLV